MSRRQRLLVIGLTVGDYFLWSWSLNGNHDVIALVAGLTLPPLALVSVWLLALSGARLLRSLTRRPVVASPRASSRGRGTQSAPAPLETAAPRRAEPQRSRRIAA